jgi:hypothetical protein
VAEAFARGSTWRRVLGDGRAWFRPTSATECCNSLPSLAQLSLASICKSRLPQWARLRSRRRVLFRQAWHGEHTLRHQSRSTRGSLWRRGLDQAGRLRPCRAHSSTIERFAWIKNPSWRVEEPGSVMIRPDDVDQPRRFAKAKRGWIADLRRPPQRQSELHPGHAVHDQLHCDQRADHPQS